MLVDKMSYQQRLNRQLWNYELDKWGLCSKETGLATFTVIYFYYVATGHMPQIGRTTQVVKTRQETVAEGCKDVFSYLIETQDTFGTCETANDYITSTTTQNKTYNYEVIRSILKMKVFFLCNRLYCNIYSKII